MERSTSNCGTRVSRHSALRCALLVLFAAIGAAPWSASAASEPLLRSATTWAGGDIVYPQGDAEVTAVVLRIEEGEEPPFHCHPVPTMGYVLRGEIEVETGDGRKAVFREGQAVVEVMRTVHRGRALRGPVEIVVFYAGAAGVPTTVLPADDPGAQHCDAEGSRRQSDG